MPVELSTRITNGSTVFSGVNATTAATDTQARRLATVATNQASRLDRSADIIRS